jgi:cell division protein FtsN
MKTTHKQRGGTLLGILIGIVVGVLISFGVVWTMNRTPLPFRDKGARVDRPANGEGEQGVQALPGKPGDKVGGRVGAGGDKPRFEFYKILPGSEEAAPTAKPADAKPQDAKAADAKAGEGKTKDAKAAAEPLYLQVGAFQKSSDADNLKARLALIGMDAAVMEVDVPDKGKMFRVRAGPFSNVDEMNRARKELSDNGIQTASVKGK